MHSTTTCRSVPYTARSLARSRSRASSCSRRRSTTSELGDFLELLHVGGDQLVTARFSVWEYRDLELSQKAWARWVEQQRGESWAQQSTHLGNRPSEYEARVRLWHEAPNRYRAERAIVRGFNSELCTRVIDGVDEWYYAPSSGIYKNPSNGSYVECGVLLEPGVLLGSMRFGDIARGERAGRATVSARATLSDGERAPESLQELGLGADHYQLEADAEHGVLLDFAAVFEGADMFRLSVEEAAFNEALPEKLFRLEAPPDVPIIDTAAISPPETMPLEEAARRASFMLLVPRRAPSATRLSVSYQTPQQSPRLHERAYLQYVFPTGSHSLVISETDAATSPSEAPDDWTSETRAGQPLRHRDYGSQRDLELEKHGTRVRISSTLELETLLELALSLEAAPTEPPQLTDA